MASPNAVGPELLAGSRMFASRLFKKRSNEPTSSEMAVVLEETSSIKEKLGPGLDEFRRFFVEYSRMSTDPRSHPMYRNFRWNEL